MNCPYCAERVNYGATVCKTCRRDIGLVVSLRTANQKLEDKVHELEAELARLRPDETVEETEEIAPPRPPGIADLAAVHVLLPIFLLMGAHYLLVVKFDANLVWLRVISIVLPALFGAVLERKLRARWYVTLGIGAIVGLAAVLGMSTTVHFTDGDPILPHNAVDWRETLEYATSIALGYLLGALLVFAMQPITSSARGGRISKVARLAARMASGRHDIPSQFEDRVLRMVKLIRLGISIATAAGAVYTGLKNFL